MYGVLGSERLPESRDGDDTPKELMQVRKILHTRGLQRKRLPVDKQMNVLSLCVMEQRKSEDE